MIICLLSAMFHCVQVALSGQQTNVCETHHVRNVTAILCVGSKFTRYSRMLLSFFRVLTPKLQRIQKFAWFFQQNCDVRSKQTEKVAPLQWLMCFQEFNQSASLVLRLRQIAKGRKAVIISTFSSQKVDLRAGPCCFTWVQQKLGPIYETSPIWYRHFRLKLLSKYNHTNPAGATHDLLADFRPRYKIEDGGRSGTFSDTEFDNQRPRQPLRHL